MPGITDIQLYPNSDTTIQFIVQFSKTAPGNYTVEMINVIEQTTLQLTNQVQSEEQLKSISFKGLTSFNYFKSKSR